MVSSEQETVSIVFRAELTAAVCIKRVTLLGNADPEADVLTQSKIT
jgi:hypothetical protein